eukprot:gene1585-3700_t
MASAIRESAAASGRWHQEPGEEGWQLILCTLMVGMAIIAVMAGATLAWTLIHRMSRMYRTGREPRRRPRVGPACYLPADTNTTLPYVLVPKNRATNRQILDVLYAALAPHYIPGVTRRLHLVTLEEGQLLLTATEAEDAARVGEALHRQMTTGIPPVPGAPFAALQRVATPEYCRGWGRPEQDCLQVRMSLEGRAPWRPPATLTIQISDPTARADLIEDILGEHAGLTGPVEFALADQVQQNQPFDQDTQLCRIPRNGWELLLSVRAEAPPRARDSLRIMALEADLRYPDRRVDLRRSMAAADPDIVIVMGTRLDARWRDVGAYFPHWVATRQDNALAGSPPYLPQRGDPGQLPPGGIMVFMSRRFPYNYHVNHVGPHAPPIDLEGERRPVRPDYMDIHINLPPAPGAHGRAAPVPLHLHITVVPWGTPEWDQAALARQDNAVICILATNDTRGTNTDRDAARSRRRRMRHWCREHDFAPVPDGSTTWALPHGHTARPHNPVPAVLIFAKGVVREMVTAYGADYDTHDGDPHSTNERQLAEDACLARHLGLRGPRPPWPARPVQFDIALQTEEHHCRAGRAARGRTTQPYTLRLRRGADAARLLE